MNNGNWEQDASLLYSHRACKLAKPSIILPLAKTAAIVLNS